jgi:glycosyltransferase involved in cell wall biosynthesis
MTSHRTLYFFTHTFPFGREESFVENEIAYLADSFTKVVVVPLEASGSPRPLPAHVSVDTSLSARIRGRKALQKLGWIPVALRSPRFYSEIRAHPAFLYRPKLARRLFSFIAKTEISYSWLLRQDHAQGNFYYTYWLYESAAALALLKANHNSQIQFVSRAHGYDLYETSLTTPKIPMRQQTLHEITSVFAVSQCGLKYLQSKYPEAKDKIHVSRLGVAIPSGMTDESGINRFSSVTCANMIASKRIDLWIRVLASVARRHDKVRFDWTHFGDGTLRNELQELARNLLPSNVRHSFQGRTPNHEVLEFYKSNAVDLFVSLSRSEGIPVSIMEAMAAGIPCLATSVGGTPELVDSNCGYLLSSEADEDEVTHALEQILADRGSLSRKRPLARLKVDTRFNRDVNYPAFVRDLQEFVA